ncbi:MAG: hypothetical protein ACE5SW_05360 [Nitrososphaeraceae archaeon]
MGQMINVVFIFLITVVMGIITIILANLFDIFLKPSLLPLFLSTFITIVDVCLGSFHLCNTLFA